MCHLSFNANRHSIIKLVVYADIAVVSLSVVSCTCCCSHDLVMTVVVGVVYDVFVLLSLTVSSAELLPVVAVHERHRIKLTAAGAR